MEPDAGHAAHSAVGALPPQLTAGQAQAVTVTACDAAGNATAGSDRVELMLDSVAEGRLLACCSKQCRSCSGLLDQLAVILQLKFLDTEMGLPQYAMARALFLF